MGKVIKLYFAVSWITAASAAPAPWREVRSPHFTVITNSGDKAGRQAGWEFEQIRAALVGLWPWAKIDSGQPFTIFAVEDETTLKTLGPQFWEGKRYRPTSFGAVGPDRNYIALRTDVRAADEFGLNPYQSAYWSYTAAVFRRSFPRPLPLWYLRGVAAVMSNTIVREREMRVGIPTRENVRLVREGAVIPFQEFFSADEGSHWLTQEIDAQRFDAQAWALVHYLIFGEKGTHNPKLSQFNRMLYQGTSVDVAMKESFGDMRVYYEAARSYVRNSLFSFSTVPVSLDTRQEAYAIRTLPPAEAVAERGHFLLAMNRPAEARFLAEEAGKADPGAPGKWEIEGELLDREGQRNKATAAFEQAAAAGSKREHVYYRLAQLEWKGDADKVRLERLATTLEKARELDPGSARVLSFLADTRVGLGQAEEALGLAKKAVELEPGRYYHRLSLARVLWSLKRWDDSIQVAQTALEAAQRDTDRATVQSFLDFAARSRPSP